MQADIFDRKDPDLITVEGVRHVLYEATRGSKNWEFSWLMSTNGPVRMGVTGFFKNDEGVWEEYIVCEVPVDSDYDGAFEDIELISNAPRFIWYLLNKIDMLEKEVGALENQLRGGRS